MDGEKSNEEMNLLEVGNVTEAMNGREAVNSAEEVIRIEGTNE
jgi:hypothetical protein